MSDEKIEFRISYRDLHPSDPHWLMRRIVLDDDTPAADVDLEVWCGRLAFNLNMAGLCQRITETL